MEEIRLAPYWVRFTPLSPLVHRAGCFYVAPVCVRYLMVSGAPRAFIRHAQI